ncbi:hypothetical protein FAUST_1346 [Fusarium austroamericanum]|uniref:Pisatin demethylase n=1 Tax=Fusarium austroamericanum TaxID=282268 RepID=A0AAN6C8U1_FUSAU|nr:hypothetical protein FAUST_1346 [Fusarium austroamericanum]
MSLTETSYIATLVHQTDWRSLAISITVFTISSIVVWWVTTYFTSPLRKYPGPGLAAWTNLWRLAVVRKGSYHLKIKELHEKYGPVIRIGPNTLDLDIPDLIKTLYGTDGKWKKTEFYHNNSAVIDGKITYHLFSTTDQAEHARMKRPIVKYYSQSSVIGLEPLFDDLILDFCGHLENRFMNVAELKECDLGEWIGFYSWDTNGAASFSQRFGYMDKGHDFDGTISIADKALDYFAAVGQMPWLDFLLDKNPLVRIGPPNLGNVTRISLEHLIARLQGKDINYNPKVPDFLQHFIESKETHPDLVNDGIIMGYLLVNLLAGADTTAITIRAIFWYALHNPKVYKKLEEEILAADLADVVSFSSARALPYLEACAREAMRMHPGVCMLLERYVPETGLRLPDGSVVPAGTAVGINPYVSNRNKSIWGKDADTYRPERWLRNEDETETTFKERLRVYNAADLTFGSGSRVCIGRNVAQLELYKIVATLIRKYEISLVDPEAPWVVTGSWFPRQKGLKCYLKKRE